MSVVQAPDFCEHPLKRNFYRIDWSPGIPHRFGFFRNGFFVFLRMLEMGQKGKDLSFWNNRSPFEAIRSRIENLVIKKSKENVQK